MQLSYRTYNSTLGVVYRCPNITIQNNETIHNAISEVSKGDCIIMGDFNHGNINPYSAGVPLMGRFKNQTQPNVIIDIYF